MNNNIFTNNERDKVMEYFGKKTEELTLVEFEQRHKELRTKYHPDKFEKYSDEVVKELSAEKFKEIEQLADKIRNLLSSGSNPEIIIQDPFGRDAKFAYNNLKIEIITRDKDLKYYLFGTHYRWLEKGVKFPIKGTNASIIIDANYLGRSIGFNEGIKMYLTFSETDSLDFIFLWLYQHIANYATSVIIEGNVVKVDYDEMLLVVKRKTLLKLGDG